MSDPFRRLLLLEVLLLGFWGLLTAVRLVPVHYAIWFVVSTQAALIVSTFGQRPRSQGRG